MWWIGQIQLTIYKVKMFCVYFVSKMIENWQWKIFQMARHSTSSILHTDENTQHFSLVIVRLLAIISKHFRENIPQKQKQKQKKKANRNANEENLIFVSLIE